MSFATVMLVIYLYSQHHKYFNLTQYVKGLCRAIVTLAIDKKALLHNSQVPIILFLNIQSYKIPSLIYKNECLPPLPNFDASYRRNFF